MRRHRATAVTTKPALFIAGLLLIAASLRAPITDVAPLLDTLRTQFDLSPSQGGFLTALPLIAFGVLSPFAALLAREYGLERALFGALLVTAAGVAVRSVGPVWCLYLGTGILGAGIAVSTVLLPSVFKRDFPDKVATITGMGAIAIGAGAALASATAVPLSNAFGWQIALGGAVLFPMAALVAWSPMIRRHTQPAQGTATPPHGGPVWHSALAWQVTLLMGVTSLLYYVVVAWLPSILTSAGYSAATAGSIHGLMQLAWAIPGLVLGPIVGRMKDQKGLAALLGVLTAAALLGFCFAPHWATLWAVCFGLGSGGASLLAMIFIGLRTGNARQSAALSGMAQCVGNLLAACGPPLAGMLHHVTGNWTAPLMIGVTLALVMVVLGVLAGRPRIITAPISL